MDHRPLEPDLGNASEGNTVSFSLSFSRFIPRSCLDLDIDRDPCEEVSVCVIALGIGFLSPAVCSGTEPSWEGAVNFVFCKGEEPP
jgi:hypothetical protein